MKALLPSILAFLLLWSCEAMSLLEGGSRGFVFLMELIACFGLLGIFWVLGLGIHSFGVILKWRFEGFFLQKRSHQYASIFTLLYLSALQVFALQSLVLYFQPKFRQVVYLGLAAGLGSLALIAILILIYQPLTYALSLLLGYIENAWEKIAQRSNGNTRRIIAFFNPFGKSGLLIYSLIFAFSLLSYLQEQFSTLHTLDFRWIYLGMIWVYALALVSSYHDQISLFVDEIKELFFKKQHTYKIFFFLFYPHFWYTLLILLSIYGLWAAAMIDDRMAVQIQRDTRVASQVLGILQTLSDTDGDGASAYFGQNDCQPNQPRVYPLATDQNQQDLNCNQNRFQNQNPLTSQEFTPFSLPTTPSENWHVILLTVDALRYDQAMKYMPKLKAFAEKNISFSQAYSHAPATYWSLPALLTGKMPSTIEMANDQTPQPQELLLTEMLSAQQYHTALFANVTIFFVRGLRQGMYVSDYKTSDYTIHGALPGAKHLREGMTKYIDDFMASKIQPKKDKFFLWGHFYDPHDPYFDVPSYPAQDQSDLSRYQAILKWMDDEIAIFIDDLQKRGLLDKSMIVITADHGEEFMDHQHRFHGKTLYEEMLRVPLILSIPHFQKKENLEQVLSLPIGQRSIVPTLLDFLKIDRTSLYKNPLVSKQSFFPLLQNPALLAQKSNVLDLKQTVFFEALADQNYAENLVGLRNQQHKMIYHLNDGILEYYDLNLDPLERDNRFEQVTQDTQLKTLYHQLMQYVDFQRHLIWSKKANHK